MQESGQLHPHIKKGKIVFIPKPGHLNQVTNYRPITLLNSAYKVQAKLIATRLKPMLPSLIRPSQTGFVPGRSILDNIFAAEEAMEWAVESKQNLVLMLLDYEKAFDRVSWTFLHAVMSKLGFNDDFIRWTASLYQGSDSMVMVNGEASPAFSLGRAVRQGCPLAPYLYIIVADVLGYMLQDQQYGVQGLKLPNGAINLEMLFAEDTSLSLLGTRDNLDKVMRVLDLYCAASGSKINWSKTNLIWALTAERTWSWGDVHGAHWLLIGESCRYLGVPLGFRVPQRVRNEKVLTSIRDSLIHWSSKALSQAGRLLIANQVILASLWYLALTADIGLSTLKIAHSLVRNYLWSGRREGRTRARVAWDAAIAPLAHGGIKIIDLVAQTQALLVKFMIRGLQEGPGAWRALLQHRVNTITPAGAAKWPPGPNWLMTGVCIKLAGSNLWGAVWKAWCNTRTGITQVEPSSLQEILRQPLFGNPWIQSNGIPMGLEPGSRFSNWAAKGIRYIKHIWNNEENEWHSALELLRSTRSWKTNELRTRLIDNIPRRPDQAITPGKGHWISPNLDTEPNSIYHIADIQENRAFVDVYRQSTHSSELASIGPA